MVSLTYAVDLRRQVHALRLAVDAINNIEPTMKNIKVLFYVPNIICYLRIIVSFYSVSILQQQQKIAAATNTTDDTAYISMGRFYVVLVCIAMFTDLLDGYFARLLNQCSNTGVFLDVVADNILRTSLWM